MIGKAIGFATEVHKTQKRKGKDVPYITHPLAVAMILARVGATEDQIIAGILHDTIEDCVPYGSVTRELLEKEFNAQIAHMVSDLTEPAVVLEDSDSGEVNHDKKATWLQRKIQAVAHIKHMSHESLLVKSADVLHNLCDLLADIGKDGDAAFASFNASKEDTIKRYQILIAEIQVHWPENPLRTDLEENVQKLINVT